MNKTLQRYADVLCSMGVIGVCTVAGFCTGQQTQKYISQHKATEIAQSPRLPPREVSSPDSIDLDKVLIERVATIGFTELYDLMEAASPDLRLKWLKQIRDMAPSPERAAAMTTYYKTLIQLDPAAAIESFVRSDRGERLLAIPILSGAAMPSALPMVAKALYQFSPDDTSRGHGPDYFGEVLNEWGWFDPVAVAHFLEQNKKGDSVEYIGTVIGYWAELDPAAAKEWLDRMDPHQQVQNAELDWLWGYFANDRSAAVNFALAHAEEFEVKKALGGMIAELLTESPQAATSFLNRLPNDEARHDALFEFALWTQGTSDKPSETFGHPSDAAAKWLITLPPELWPRELADVLSNWERDQPDTLVAWLNGLPAENHDQLVATYVASNRERRSISDSDEVQTPDLPARDLLERRLNAAMTISDVTKRDAALREFLESNFSELSHEQSQQVIQQSALPLATKVYVVKLLSEEQ